MNNNIPVIFILVIILSSCTEDIRNVKEKSFNEVYHFPDSTDPQEQISEIKNYLSCSEGTCAVQVKDTWIIKPTEEVNFRESSDLWMFSDDSVVAAIKKLQAESYLLTLFNRSGISNTIRLYGRLNEIQISDINNDGHPDILLGINKKVHFDQAFKKRINIYSYQNKNLQPLWLGTKFIYDIESFRAGISGNTNYLFTLEVDGNGRRFQGIYEWDDFGFALKEINQL